MEGLAEESATQAQGMINKEVEKALTVYDDIQGQIQKVEKLSPAEARVIHVNELLKSAYEKASTLILTQEESEALMKEFTDDEIEIKPTGELYIPHIYIRERLTQVLRPGQWTPVLRSIKKEGNKLMAEVVLLIRGTMCGEAWGAMDYYPTGRMDYTDALEGAQGEAVRRIAAKTLSCGSQVWKPAFCREWIKKYGEQYETTDKYGKKVKRWKRKDSAMVEELEPESNVESNEKPKQVIVIGLIDEVQKKQSGTGILYLITVDNIKYSTFKKEFAEKANNARISGSKVEIIHEQNQYNSIIDLKIIDI